MMEIQIRLWDVCVWSETYTMSPQFRDGECRVLYIFPLSSFSLINLYAKNMMEGEGGLAGLNLERPRRSGAAGSRGEGLHGKAFTAPN